MPKSACERRSHRPGVKGGHFIPLFRWHLPEPRRPQTQRRGPRAGLASSVTIYLPMSRYPINSRKTCTILPWEGEGGCLLDLPSPRFCLFLHSGHCLFCVHTHGPARPALVLVHLKNAGVEPRIEAVGTYPRLQLNLERSGKCAVVSSLRSFGETTGSSVKRK